MATRDIIRRLERASTDINSLMITRPMTVNFFSIYGGNRNSACAVFKAMESKYQKYLEENELINPYSKGVPNKLAREFLELYGITEERINKDLEKRRTKNSGGEG